MENFTSYSTLRKNKATATKTVDKSRQRNKNLPRFPDISVVFHYLYTPISSRKKVPPRTRHIQGRFPQLGSERNRRQFRRYSISRLHLDSTRLLTGSKWRNETSFARDLLQSASQGSPGKERIYNFAGSRRSEPLWAGFTALYTRKPISAPHSSFKEPFVTDRSGYRTFTSALVNRKVAIYRPIAFRE